MIQYAVNVYELINRLNFMSGEDGKDALSGIRELGLYPEQKNVLIYFIDDELESIIHKHKLKKFPELKWIDKGLVRILRKEGINSLLILKDL